MSEPGSEPKRSAHQVDHPQVPKETVTVVIPAYNRRGSVARAVESVLAQRGSFDVDPVVVDDHSVDGTAAEAARAGARVVELGENRGASGARNAGVAVARSEWIGFLDSDDAWLPSLLETLWPLRRGHVAVAGTSIILEQGHAPLLHGSVRSGVSTLSDPPQLMLPFNPIPASGVLVQRSAFLCAGGYRSELRYSEDFDLWIRLLGLGSIALTSQPVTQWTRHREGKSSHRGAPQSARVAIVREYAGEPWWSEQLVEDLAAVQAWGAASDLLRARRLREACRLLRGGLRSRRALRAIVIAVKAHAALRRRSPATLDEYRRISEEA